MSNNESMNISKPKKKLLVIQNFKYPSTDLDKYCYLYDSEKYKYAIVCIDTKHFVKIKLKKNPKGYDKVYAHMVKILRNALEIAQSKYNSTEFIVFLDMVGSSMKQIDMTFAKTLIVILESTFTDNLKYCIVKNAPRLFKIVYRLIYPFIDKVTRNKFMFEKKGKLNRIILNGIQK